MVLEKSCLNGNLTNASKMWCEKFGAKGIDLGWVWTWPSLVILVGVP